MNSLSNLEERIAKIESRNRKVEIEKAWETSSTRKVLLVISTYTLMTIFMYVIKVERPFVSAIIPTFGYILSTLSLPFIKRFWQKHRMGS